MQPRPVTSVQAGPHLPQAAKRAGAFRLAALLVCALFFWGQLGAADLDALVFHSGSGAVAVARPHVESNSASQHDHADHCLVAFRLSATVDAGALQPTGPAAIPPEHAALLPPAASPHRFLPGLHQHSRAPPQSLA
jgi:hypothetical protein